MHVCCTVCIVLMEYVLTLLLKCVPGPAKLKVLYSTSKVFLL